MSTPSAPVLALDFGGTKLAAAVVDTASGTILAYQCQTTPPRQGAPASIESMFNLGNQALAEAGMQRPARVGISFGGPVSVDRQQVLVSYHVADWEGKRLPSLAAEAFGCPAAMDNDANAAALGAWGFDALRQPDHLVYIQISTGVGAGLILNRDIFRGGALAGEFGHITMQVGGPPCPCGKRGCVEALCSGWAIARDGLAALPHAASGSPLHRLSQRAAGDPDARLVLQAAREGDPLAHEIAERAFGALGVAIANVICLLDPQVVMLGGGITQSQDIIRPIIETTLVREVPAMFKDRCQLRFCTLQGRETLLGAALLG
jgi:glucokinase